MIADGANVIPDHKLVLVSFDAAEPAYFLSALLNSAPIRLFVRSYTVQTSISGHIFDYVALPQFSSGNSAHKKIAKLAHDCHFASEDKIQGHETKLDELVTELLGLSAANVTVMRDELDLLRGISESDDGDEE